MMTACVETENLAVQGMRQPRQRMPVRLLRCAESPCDILPAQSRVHMGIVDDVVEIIQINIGMCDHRKIDDDGENEQCDAN